MFSFYIFFNSIFSFSLSLETVSNRNFIYLASWRTILQDLSFSSMIYWIFLLVYSLRAFNFSLKLSFVSASSSSTFCFSLLASFTLSFNTFSHSSFDFFRLSSSLSCNENLAAKASFWAIASYKLWSSSSFSNLICFIDSISLEF